MEPSKVWAVFVFGNFCGVFLVGSCNELIQAIGISILIGCSVLSLILWWWGKLLVGGNSYGS